MQMILKDFCFPPSILLMNIFMIRMNSFMIKIQNQKELAITSD